MTRIAITLTAALLAASPLALPTAFAQMSNMKLVQDSATTELAKLGITDIDVEMLTLKQLQEIELIAGSSSDMSKKQQQIHALVEREPGSQAQ